MIYGECLDFLVLLADFLCFFLIFLIFLFFSPLLVSCFRIVFPVYPVIPGFFHEKEGSQGGNYSITTNGPYLDTTSRIIVELLCIWLTMPENSLSALLQVSMKEGIL